MLRKIKIHGARWVDGVGLSLEEKKELLAEHHFHELDIEACLEENQTARIDAYDNYLFIILHFPKYNRRTKSYELNEFNIFIGKDFIITLRNADGTQIDTIFDKYKTAKAEKDKEIKLSSGFILYEMIQSMLEKMFKVSANVKKDLRGIENQVFDHATSTLVKEIMIKKRNIVVLKHMFNPQVTVLNRIEHHINNLFIGEIEVYFEDLEDKLGHIVNNIRILEEHIDSIEDAFKTIIDMRTNQTIKFLTIFSALILPLTLITSFYGMNVPLPYKDSMDFVWILLIGVAVLMGALFLYFRSKGRI